MNNIIEKYSESVLKNLDKDNFNNILIFLINEKCNFVEDIVEDYLDVFTIDYNEFIIKYNYLNEKYNNCYLELVSKDLNLLEEFFDD